MKTKCISAVCILFLLISYNCKSNVGNNQNTYSNAYFGELNNNSGSIAENSDGKLLRFVKRTIFDRDVFGCEAISMFIPEGWRLEGGVTNRGESTTIDYSIISEDGSSLFKPYREFEYQWHSDPWSNQAYMNNPYPTIKPLNAQGYLKSVFIPQYRKDYQNLRIVSLKRNEEAEQMTIRLSQMELRETAKWTPIPENLGVDANIVETQLEYEINGTVYLEDIVVKVRYMNNQYGSNLTTIWQPSVTSFLSPKDEYAKNKQKILVTIQTIKVNEQWSSELFKLSIEASNRRNQIQAQELNAIRERSRITTELGDYFRKLNAQSREYNSSVFDRLSEQRSEAMLGENTYVDRETGSNFKIPVGYETGWTDGNKLYISTEASFNPNVSVGGNWRPLTKNKITEDCTLKNQHNVLPFFTHQQRILWLSRIKGILILLKTSCR